MSPQLQEHLRRYQTIALVLQGGGALGSYQAGAYAAMSEADVHPGWVAGVSIGAINAALIAGNAVEQRVARLDEFWRTVTTDTGLTWLQWYGNYVGELVGAHTALNAMSAISTVMVGQPGMFRPRPLAATGLMECSSPAQCSYYDTSPLRATLERLVDFDRINARETRFSVGAVNIRTGNYIYFDNAEIAIRPEHVMASCALPPGFPAVEIDGEFYWDGGVVSNTPLQYVLDFEPTADTLAFQVDLWSAQGPLPHNLIDLMERQKDVSYSSRTRYTTDQIARTHKLRRAIDVLLRQAPQGFADLPEFAILDQYRRRSLMNIIHLIYRRKEYETYNKDYEFSRLSMNEHWAAGRADTLETLTHVDWLAPPSSETGIVTHDLHRLGERRDKKDAPVGQSVAPQRRRAAHKDESGVGVSSPTPDADRGNAA